jgi:hypothetical protein
MYQLDRRDLPLRLSEWVASSVAAPRSVPKVSGAGAGAANAPAKRPPPLPSLSIAAPPPAVWTSAAEAKAWAVSQPWPQHDTAIVVTDEKKGGGGKGDEKSAAPLDWSDSVKRAIDRFYDWVRDPDTRSLVAPLWTTTAVLSRSELDRNSGEMCGVRIACPLDPSHPVLQFRICERRTAAARNDRGLTETWAEFVPRTNLSWLNALEWVHSESRLPDSPLAIAPIRALVLEYARAVAPDDAPAIALDPEEPPPEPPRAFPVTDVEAVDVSSGGLRCGFHTRRSDSS